MAEAKTTIPAGPWTEEYLGTELYEKLAVEYSVCRPEPSFRPSLDLTTPYKEQLESAKAKKPAPPTAT